MSRLARITLAFGLGGGLALGTASAQAQTAIAIERGVDTCANRSVCGARERDYFLAHGSATATLALGALITGNAFPASSPRVAADVAPALGLADATLTLELASPVPAVLVSMNTSESFDALLTYTQVLFAAQLVDHVLRTAKLDASTTLAFSAAVSSAYLFDQSRAVGLHMQGAFWGLQLGLATANATLNVRGGRSGVGGTLLGAGLGIGLGVLAQELHSHWSSQAIVPSPLALYADRNDAARYHDNRDRVWALSVLGIGGGFALSMLAPRAVRDPNLDIKVVPAPYGASLMVGGKL